MDAAASKQVVLGPVSPKHVSDAFFERHAGGAPQTGPCARPRRYVGAAPQEEDSEPFEEKMKRLTAGWREQQAEAARPDAAIAADLAEPGFGRFLING